MWKACGVLFEYMQRLQAGFDTQWYHSTEDANLWYSRLPTSVCFLFFFIIILIQKDPTASCIQYGLAFQHLSLQNSITVLPFCLSFSLSFIQNLENAFIIFHNNAPNIINLSLCSFLTMLSMIVPEAAGEDRYKWHRSQAGSSLCLPSDKRRLEESNAASPSVVSVYNLCLFFF